ncbi:MAG: hypothetical protein MJ033_01140 [Victivallaceae bacterium]|nr:hypothetical protein [Victivallaceae bacterium]
MNKRQLIFSLFLGSAAVVLAADATSEMRQTIERTEMYYQEFARNADRLVSKANDLYGVKRYEEAIKLYIDVKLLLEPHSNAPAFAKQIEYCDKQIASCYYHWALDLMDEAEELAQQRNFEEAIALCRKAVKFCPEQAGVLEEKIAYLEKRRDLAIARDAVSETTLVPNKENQAYQIEILMEQGRRLVAAKDYSRALRKFQEVLLITPYHSDAMQNIQSINRKIGKIGLGRYTDTRRDLVAEAEWKEAIPFRPDANSEAGENLLEDGKPVAKAVQDNDELNKKLESIVIPKVSFADASIADAVKFLAEISQQYDPEKRGVNFLLRRPVKAVAASDSSAAAAGSSDVYVSTSDSGKDVLTGDVLLDKKIDMDLENKTLLAILRQLCQKANLRYRIEKYAVIVAPPNVALDELEAKLFAVDIAQGDSDSDLRAKCEASGVTFPDGAKLFYDNKINRLVAINTAENLRMIEEKVLPQYDIKTPMIQIMIKFIEITQNDLDELAFNWQFALNTASDPNSSTWSTRSESSNELLRYYKPDNMENDAMYPSTVPNDANLNFVWQNSDGLKIKAQMFALNWADSTDILYSPRVTTLDKMTAHVGMYKEQYFPKDWEMPDIESNDVQTGLRLSDIDAQPVLDNLQKLGLSFDITPEIRDLDNGLIYIPVRFPIRLFSGWKTYDARSYGKGGDIDGEFYRMPIFDDREISTEVMIRDGETVILAGVTTDVSKIVHDKIPLLGDIPLIGRLFQSRYTKSEKGNLLIFLTCRLVKSDGTAYNPAASERRRGLPGFGRME